MNSPGVLLRVRLCVRGCVCMSVCVSVFARHVASRNGLVRRHRVGCGSPAPPAATPPAGARAAAPAPLGPGGGWPLSPDRASEHVQSRAPARPPPAARRPPAACSAPASCAAAAQPGRPQPQGAWRRRPVSWPRLAACRGAAPGLAGAGGARLRALRGCGLGAPGRRARGRRSGRLGRPRSRVSPASWVLQPGPPCGLQPGFFFPAGHGQTSLCKRGRERGGAAPALASGRAGGGAFRGTGSVSVCAWQGALRDDKAGAGCARQLPKLNVPPGILRDRPFPRREPWIWTWGVGARIRFGVRTASPRRRR